MKNHFIIVIGLLSFLLFGCYPDGPEYTEDFDLVLTNYEEDYNFPDQNTYAMPNRIVKITGSVLEGEEPEFMPEATATLVLATIAANMQRKGWQRVDISENPDVLLTPASLEVTTITYWYDYWSWWWGGYYPGWGYPPYYVTSYTTGTLLMSLIDPAVESASGNPIFQWTGAINGILTGSYDASRVNTAIDQAFAQSPYLTIN
jgi:hypothetical protein